MTYLLAAPRGIQERSSWDCTDTQTGGEASNQLLPSASPLPWAGWGRGREGAAASPVVGLPAKSAPAGQRGPLSFALSSPFFLGL